MKTSKFKIKIICGYEKDQQYTIDANEAHKAYYLFNNPEKRGTFSDGLSLIGKDIRRIVPDYNATMGWNHDHRLTGDDWNDIHANGVMRKLQRIMAGAKEVARTAGPEDLQTPLVNLRDRFPALYGGGSDYAKEVLKINS